MMWAIVAPAQSTNTLRVGVYDSRAVAVAYANSAEFAAVGNAVKAEHDKAKAANDEKTMKAIEFRMQQRQHRAHEQGFSTGSVLPIMETITNKLAVIARNAHVDVIVSKWELNFASEDVEIVDVTDRIVAQFHVSERGLKWAKEIQQRPPLSLDELPDHKH